MHRVGRSWFAAILTVALIAACRPANVASRPPDKCAEYNGGIFNRVKGSLLGKQARGRQLARRLRPVGGGVPHSGLAVTITPICGNLELDSGQLREGRFVGVLTGRGTAPRFSSVANDTVFWWVFGEEIRLPDGRDTLVFHSQFFSMKAPASAQYALTVPLQVCVSDRRRGDDEPNEMVDWHEAVCDTTSTHMLQARMLGDRPWFGCTRGCCFAQMPKLGIERDSLPTDSLPRDTAQMRDTT